jgi:hypothetical protein
MPATTGSYQVQVAIKNAPAANISANCRVGDWKLMIPGITVTAASDATLVGLIGECEITASHNPLVQAASLWLDRYKTLTKQGDRITGASYVDDHAISPGLTILQFK